MGTGSSPPNGGTLAHRVASAVRFFRQRAGLSQRALGERTGIPRPSVVRLESGEALASVDTLDRIATALDIPLQELFAAVDGRRIRWLPGDVRELESAVDDVAEAVDLLHNGGSIAPLIDIEAKLTSALGALGRLQQIARASDEPLPT